MTQVAEEAIRADIRNCARCGLDHPQLAFSQLTQPVEAEPGVAAYTFTHWAACPNNGEPILMRHKEP